MFLELPHAPAWVYVAIAVAMFLLAVGGCLVLALAIRRRNRRAREEPAPSRNDLAGLTPDERAEHLAKERQDKRADRLVSIAATVSILLYLGLFASSFEAISGFAREFLRRQGIMVPATPLTLDGVVIGALLLSLAFIAKRKSPAKANALIWGMTIFAAYCGFTYGDSGDHGSLSAGLYYAVMSIVGMFMFHMVLDLYQGEGDYIKSQYPAMKLRWFTHWSTIPVMLAWINHPPRRRDEDKRPTTREAIDHWRHVKTIRRRARSIEAARTHALKLEGERRKAELATARRDVQRAETAAAAPVSPAPMPAQRQARTTSVVALDSPRGERPITAAVQVPPPAEQPVTTAPIKVPATADGCATWMTQWMKLIEHAPQFAKGQSGIKNEDAQAAAGCTDRQARFVRDAARGGALRAKAAELAVPLPTGYVDRPELVMAATVEVERVNGTSYSTAGS
ncbi:DUF2637 domain-containing protein [Micromonospora sp. NPDC049662]|uniref:DUF2637 domain-containing protein n=1 Tax=Micromonospora sp. NPDC049662 TaxID=3155397 RepID=UPI0034362775